MRPARSRSILGSRSFARRAAKRNGDARLAARTALVASMLFMDCSGSLRSCGSVPPTQSEAPTTKDRGIQQQARALPPMRRTSRISTATACATRSPWNSNWPGYRWGTSRSSSGTPATRPRNATTRRGTAPVGIAWCGSCARLTGKIVSWTCSVRTEDGGAGRLVIHSWRRSRAPVGGTPTETGSVKRPVPTIDEASPSAALPRNDPLPRHSIDTVRDKPRRRKLQTRHVVHPQPLVMAVHALLVPDPAQVLGSSLTPVSPRPSR